MLATVPRALAGGCSQPLSSGDIPVATDCLYILEAAVGLVTCAPPCICSPTGGEITKAADALLCLRVAIGQDLAMQCPCAGSTTTTTTVLPASTTSSTAPPGCPTLDTCFEDRGPKQKDFRDSDGCSADAVLSVLESLGVTPSDPQAVKDDPVSFFTGGLCSAPFGNAGSFDAPRACEMHDACFTICGQDRGTCNAEFAAHLAETCVSKYVVGPCRDSCLVVATAYATYVATGDDSAWRHDQELSCTCCPDQSACGNGVCERDLGEGEANCPDDCSSLPDGSECYANSECESAFCSSNATCGVSLCGDGFCGVGESCGETRFCPSDCGGCPDGSPCLLNSDCASDYCFAFQCATKPFCGDGSCNGLEVCGASDSGLQCIDDCGKCPNGTICLTDAVCESDICNLGFCSAGDLGAGSLCSTDRACKSGNCEAGICAPACGDGVCNGTEICGDSNSGLECNKDCGKCPTGTPCLSNPDCQSGICNFGFCISGPLNDGSLCSTDAACKSGDCSLGICKCTGKGLGEKCSSNGECCSGKCTSIFGVKRCV